MDAFVAVRVPVGTHRVVDDNGVAGGREADGEVIIRDAALSLQGKEGLVIPGQGKPGIVNTPFPSP